MKPVVLMMSFLCLLCLGPQSLAKSPMNVKVRIGIMDLQSINGNTDLSTKATDLLLQKLADYGSYELKTLQDLKSMAEKIHLKIPQNCNDPRCVLDLGNSLGMDRMIYGSVDQDGKKVGVNLQLIDIVMRQTIEKVSLEGAEGVELEMVVSEAVKRMHGGAGDSAQKVKVYFGPEIHNEKEFLYSSAATIGTGFVWGLVNYFARSEGRNNEVDIRYYDDDYTGIPASASQIPMFARPAALGNAYVAASDDAYGVLYNPAGMAWVTGPEAVVTYQDRFGFDNIAASYVNKATREIGFGQAFLYSGDKDGLLTEMSFISAAAFKFNVQNRFLYPFSAGASLKMVSKYFKKGSLDAVGGPGFGVGMDLGLVWKLSEPIKYGLLLRDLPVIVRYNNTVTGKQYFQSEATTLHMGGTFKVGYTTFLIAEGQLPLYEDQGWKMAGGIEQEIFGLMLLRLGAQKTIMSPIQTPWKVTAGFGVKVDMPTPLLKNLSLDGSYEYNTLGIFNVINVSMKMGF